MQEILPRVEEEESSIPQRVYARIPIIVWVIIGLSLFLSIDAMMWCSYIESRL